MKYQNHIVKSEGISLQKTSKDSLLSKAFHFNGLKIEIYPEVYEPAEDTFQLIEAIKVNKGDAVLEIGTGCGIVALECARIGAEVICTDINPNAIKLVKYNYQINKPLLKGSIEIRYGDLFLILNKFERFDVIIFNPPYLPTLVKERIGGTGWFDIATDGGVDGLKLTKRFIGGLNKRLKKNGRAYFVFSTLSNRKKLNKYLNKAGLKSQIIISQWFDDEKIDIFCVSFKR